jgi:Arc/MetJ-type ribon-helix-helix transcriptional regulator
MKQKLSITMDNEAVHDIEQSIKTGKFRNKSHFIEYAVKKLLEEEKKSENSEEKIVMEYK